MSGVVWVRFSSGRFGWFLGGSLWSARGNVWEMMQAAGLCELAYPGCEA